MMADVTQLLAAISGPFADSLLALMQGVNNSWIIISFALVLMMQPGFAYLEAGLIRSTNVINVLFKNTIDFCIGGICFYAIGYSLMWNATGDGPSYVGTPHVGWLSPVNFRGGILPSVHFLFQLAFVGTAATICSGLVAGRIKVQAYCLLVVVISAVVYPVVGHWAWADQGWLKKDGFIDFAGCSVVHCLGGFAGLAGALVLGPRIAKADKGELADGRYEAAEVANYRHTENSPHNVALSTLGTFLLLLGWIGFNGGSIGPLIEQTDSGLKFNTLIGTILLNTTLSCCAGGLLSTVTSGVFNFASDKIMRGQASRLQIDLEHTLNGILGGLVGITAGCDIEMVPLQAIAIGGVSGIVVVVVVCFLDLEPLRKRIDDPVGAFAVHGACGWVGIMAVGWLKGNMEVQLKGVALISALAFGVSAVVFLLLRSPGFVGGLRWDRVSPQDELHGLDFTHHGKSGYRIRKESLYNPARKIGLPEGDLRDQLLRWRQTAVRLSPTGRFQGYESEFLNWVRDWGVYFANTAEIDPHAKLVFKEAWELIKQENEELFDDAYALICEAFEVVSRGPSYVLGEAAVAAIRASIGGDVSYEEMNKAINDAIMKGIAHLRGPAEQPPPPGHPPERQ